ncbi:MAG: quinoprotein dehydrogenase-associated putative ABC transporter substrate-binding protein [Gammaproteobacteria bacterium]
MTVSENMQHRTRTLAFWIAALIALSLAAAAAQEPTYRLEKDFDELTQAEHTAAKEAAKTEQIRPLVACADPGNMPLSNKRGAGFDNRIVKLLAREMNTKVSFFWRPYLERGLTRETFANRECDLLLGMPEDYSDILTTIPIYRSTYVFAYREDSGIHIENLNDPELQKLRVGVYQHSGMREALARHGVKNNLDIQIIRQNTDVVPENQQWRQVQRVVDGELDIAGVWGPFAGYVKAKKDGPLVLQPANVMEDVTPLEFSLAIGMRPNDVVLKYALDNALKAREKEVKAILEEFGVPLVNCSDCVVQGELPSHGSYAQSFIEEAQKRFLEPLDRNQIELDESRATADQIVTDARLEKWLENGADIDQELANAVLASDLQRTRFLAAHGADVNQQDTQGYAPLHQAASARDSDMIALLLELGADPDARDDDGWTPLMHAAFRDHVPSIKLLAKSGGDLEATTPDGYTALTLAVGEHKFWAARALLKAGANADHASSRQGLTALMLVSMHEKSAERESYLASGMEPIEMAELLIARGADVNAATRAGVTALMIAASYDNSAMIGLLVQRGADVHAQSDAGKTALDVAKDNLSEAAIQSLELFEQFAPQQGSTNQGAATEEAKQRP